MRENVKVMENKKTLKNMILKQVVKLVVRNAKQNANTACVWWDHQPKLPDAVKSLRKF